MKFFNLELDLARLITITRNKIDAPDVATSDVPVGIPLGYNRLILPLEGGLTISSRKIEHTCAVASTILRKGPRILDILYEDGVLPMPTNGFSEVDWVAVHLGGKPLFHSDCANPEELAAREPGLYERLEENAAGGELTQVALESFRESTFETLPPDALAHDGQTAIVLQDVEKSVQGSVLLRSAEGISKVSFTLSPVEKENIFAVALNLASDVVVASAEDARLQREAKAQSGAVVPLAGHERLKEIRVKFNNAVNNGRVRFWPEMPEFLVA